MADTNDRGEARIEALAVISVHCDRASAFADQRIAALAGDLKRQARWQSIRQGIDQIIEGADRGPHAEGFVWPKRTERGSNRRRQYGRDKHRHEGDEA